MKVHFLGIGGSGASAAAALAQAQGFEVTGCDLEVNNEFTTIFQPNQLFNGHNPKHLAKLPGVSIGFHPWGVQILAVTPAIFSLDPNNPELLEAKRNNIPVMTWQQFVGKYLTKEEFVIAICGTHGKTTTTAMIAQVLEDANLNPTVLLGAIHPKWNANYRVGKGKYFVVEADEFNDNFLHFKPDICVVTNIEMDHPEYFRDLNTYLDSFEKFLLQTRETIVANLLDKNVAELVKDVMKTPRQKYHDRNKFVQYLDYSRNKLSFPLKIPGEFNKLNAQAAMQVGLLLGIDPNIIKKSLSDYTGVNRRFEYIGEYRGAKVYSDFGHHPTEIKVTMEAVREKFPHTRILLVYQPHMFSRTKYLFDDFVKVFKNIPADKTYIMDIYPSREIDTGLVSSKELVETIGKNSVVYIGSANETLEKLKPEIKSGDILFFMSAGDTDKLAKELVNPQD